VAVAIAVRLEFTGAMSVVTVVRAAKVATVVVVLLVVAYYVFSFTIGSDRHGSPLVPANPSAVPL
jgi:threonine/homoserine efflux transporter RhtA